MTRTNLFKICNGSLLVTRKWWDGGSLKYPCSPGPLALQRRQASGKDRLSDQGDGHAEIQSVNGSPLTSTLLTSAVKDLLDKRSTVLGVVVFHDVTSDLDKERVQNTSVPLGENIANLGIGQTKTTLHDIVCLFES